MIAVERRLGISIVVGLLGVWLAVRPADAPPVPVLAPLDATGYGAQRSIAHEDARRWTIEDYAAERGREQAFTATCRKRGGRACCGQGGCCPGPGQSWAEFDVMLKDLTAKLP